MKKLFLALALILIPTVMFSDGITSSPVFKQYKTVCDCFPDTLDKKVTELLQQGWVLWGMPYNAENRGGMRCACQALIK